MKIVDCVLEIATGSDALVEDCVELDHVSFGSGPLRTCRSQHCSIPAKGLSHETGIRDRRRVFLDDVSQIRSWCESWEQ